MKIAHIFSLEAFQTFKLTFNTELSLQMTNLQHHVNKDAPERKDTLGTNDVSERTTVFSDVEAEACSKQVSARDIFGHGHHNEEAHIPSQWLWKGHRRGEYENDEKEYSWEDLKEIDKHRLKLLQKVELPFLRVLKSWKGTCLNAMYMDSMVWVPLFIYIFIRLSVNFDLGFSFDFAEGIDAAGINVLGGFLSFFLVLFVNQTNTRFFDMYALSRACAGRIQDVAGYASARLPPEDAHRLLRYMNAAHVAGYVGLNGPYTQTNFFDVFNEKHGMLTPDEMKKFDGIKMDGCTDIFKALCTWCQRDIALATKNELLNTYEANEMHTRILDLRAHMDGIHDTCFQPPHFFYIHFLCVITGLYLPLSAASTAVGIGLDNALLSMEILGGLVVFLQSIFVVGLRLLGQKMIDPYGDDFEDLSVITFITAGLEITHIMLNASDQGTVVKGLEQSLQRYQTSNITHAKAD